MASSRTEKPPFRLVDGYSSQVANSHDMNLKGARGIAYKVSDGFGFCSLYRQVVDFIFRGMTLSTG